MADVRVAYLTLNTPKPAANVRVGYVALNAPGGQVNVRVGYLALNVPSSSVAPQSIQAWDGTTVRSVVVYAWTGTQAVKIA